MIRKNFVNVDKFKLWINNYENLLVKEKWNGKENNSGRSCLWFGVGVNLGFKNDKFLGENISLGLKKRCSELYGSEDWNSLLLYKYEIGSDLKDHVDRKCFDKKVVIVNICDDDLFGNGIVKFRYNNEIEILKNGEVVEIDSSKKHGVCKVEKIRYSLSIRKV